MSKHIFVRPAKAVEAKLFLEWAKANQERSAFDPAVPAYTTTFTLCAFDENGPLLFMPVQQPLMLESLAMRPGATEKEIAAAIKEIFQECVTQAAIKGNGEIYFACTDEGTGEFAEGQTVFEPLPWKFYRLRLSDLEKRPNDAC